MNFNFNTLIFLQNHPEVQKIILLISFLLGLPVILITLNGIKASLKIHNSISPDLQMHLSRYLVNNSRWSLFIIGRKYTFLGETLRDR
jgi:hypothetical protein